MTSFAPRSPLFPGMTADRRSLQLRRIRNNSQVMTGGSILLLILLIALIGPLLTPSGPYETDTPNRLLPPSTTNWFGTDNFGRDLFARVVSGSHVSLMVGFSVALITSGLGLLIGLVAAYFKTADRILMRILDGFMAFPAILLAIAIMAALGVQTENVIVALSLVFTPYVARVVRSSALVVKEQTYIESLRAQGASAFRVLWVNIAPNVLSPLLIQATFIFADSIITEAALSFLGAGVPPPEPSWGNILFDGKTLIFSAWWMTVFPGLTIMLVVLGINFLGDGLRDLLDPRHKSIRK
ncbi:ABC transporter permease [Cryobacterium sp. TMT1-2-2]|uniref:ABC transporter permease n=1 Tax=Cryobacterium sp. TMT1-2-2 TaxID=1259233 RepID=UPI001069061D|nr:ABC transporter permease [Cryobacterium sp. TMT1-2-2]TFD12254.1 ABC transporter permease [Cryobacterium sp. TMT1-2-2]